MKLTELKRGESAVIKRIGNVGELKKRLIDLGINSGQIIKLERNAPLGDPQEFRINGNSIAIRKKDADNIEVE
ncbi:MAG: ferrous iron transport protein A [Fusobacteriaceae bacterium]|nr:ferrous iron transport protein A [Fusobacteriaceae bacterium]MBP6322986.1 ferrous iron transport protein A [Fusobacteriaceae bacterium]MBP9510418.1 ferrous iron transport protein A [Fusobacteriaceae bacterium]